MAPLLGATLTPLVGVASIIGLKMIKRADITTFYFYWIISLGDYDTLPTHLQ